MDVSVNHDGALKAAIGRDEILLLALRHRRLPQVAGTGVLQSYAMALPEGGQRLQPAKLIIRNAVARSHEIVEQNLQQLAKLRRALYLLLEFFRGPQHFIGVTNHPCPSQFADAIDNLGGLRPAQHQIAAVNDQVRARGFSSAVTASSAVKLPWMSETIARRIKKILSAAEHRRPPVASPVSRLLIGVGDLQHSEIGIALADDLHTHG